MTSLHGISTKARIYLLIHTSKSSIAYARGRSGIETYYMMSLHVQLFSSDEKVYWNSKDVDYPEVNIKEFGR